MVSQWCFRGGAMVGLLSMVFPWWVHRAYLVGSWCFRGRSMVSPW